MNFWQVTLGDIIGYIIMIGGFAFTIRVTVKTKYSSHHNTKQVPSLDKSKHAQAPSFGSWRHFFAYRKCLLP